MSIIDLADPRAAKPLVPGAPQWWPLRATSALHVRGHDTIRCGETFAVCDGVVAADLVARSLATQCSLEDVDMKTGYVNVPLRPPPDAPNTTMSDRDTVLFESTGIKEVDDIIANDEGTPDLTADRLEREYGCSYVEACEHALRHHDVAHAVLGINGKPDHPAEEP